MNCRRGPPVDGPPLKTKQVGERPRQVRLGISACLLGRAVRYDGGHRRDPLLIETLGEYVDWVPVCPEVECGLGVPREAMNLVGRPESPRLVTIETAIDHTDLMLSWGRKRAVELEAEHLCGFVFKSRSPSCGLAGVNVCDENGDSHQSDTGLFARFFMEHFPQLPVEDEQRLHDPVVRENFLRRILGGK